MHIPLSTRAKKVLLGLGSIVIAIAVLASVMSVGTVSASASDNLSGYAWSSNIGWISTNNCDGGTPTPKCLSTAYGVTMDQATGNLSGYAWSSNIGWISFNPAATADCPNTIPKTPCQANVSKTGKVSGWARACSVLVDPGCTVASGMATDASTGKWDGYISLGDSNTTDNIPFGVTFNAANQTFDGCSAGSCAWGSDIIGWVDLGGVKVGVVNPGVPIVTLTANPTTGKLSDAIAPTLTWTVTNNPTSCTAIPGGDWTTTGAKSTVSGSSEKQGVLTSARTYTYTMKCTNAVGDSLPASAIVTVVPDSCPVKSPCYCAANPSDTVNCPGSCLVGSSCWCALPGNANDPQCKTGGGGGSQCPNIPNVTLPLPAHYKQIKDATGVVIKCGCDAGYVMNAQFQCVIPVFQEH